MIGGTLALVAAGTIGYMAGRARSGPDMDPETLLGKDVTAVVRELEDDSRYANELTQGLVRMLDESDSIHPETYTTMFRPIRDRAEGRPELMMHFGPNAKEYLVRNYLEDRIEGFERDMTDRLRDYGRDVTDSMRDVIDYIRDRIEGDN